MWQPGSDREAELLVLLLLDFLRLVLGREAEAGARPLDARLDRRRVGRVELHAGVPREVTRAQRRVRLRDEVEVAGTDAGIELQDPAGEGPRAMRVRGLRDGGDR